MSDLGSILASIASGGVAGAVAGALLTAGLDYHKRCRSRPDTEVVLFSDRTVGEFDPDRRLPTYSRTPNGIFVCFTARNTAQWVEAKKCIPHVCILEEGSSSVIEAFGIWERVTHSVRDIAEDAKTIGPQVKERYLCLAIEGADVYFYDAMQVYEDAIHPNHLWRPVQLGKNGQFEMITYVEASNARRFYGCHYYVNCIKVNGGIDLKVRAFGLSINFAEINASSYLKQKS